MNLDHADFFAMGIEVIDSIADGFSSRTHDDNQFFCIFSTIVVEEFVITAGQFVDFVHVVLNDIRNSCYFFVSAFFCLEEDIRINSRATGVRMFRVQAVLTESCQLFIINEFCKIIIIKSFDTLHFVGCTESVEYMHESIAATNSRQMGYTAEIHSFLRGGRHNHAEASRTTCHNVRMIAENGKCMSADGTGCNVEYARQEFTANFEHGGNHEEQALGSRIGGGQRTSLQGAMACASSTSFRLHLDNINGITEDILLSFCSPFVNLFCHNRRRCDREDSSNFCKCIGSICSSRVTIHYYIVFFHNHFRPFLWLLR